MFNFLKIIILVLFLNLSAIAGNVLKNEAGNKYIQQFKNHAIKEMLLYNIPASIILAQGMLESGNGTSDLAVHANNHFGIKCHEDWSGSTFIKNDDTKDECFRKYVSADESYTDHSLFLKSRARYAQLFELNHTDYKGWAIGLKKVGYATEKNYTQLLMDLIETYELFQYDLSSQAKKKSKNDNSKKLAQQLNAEEIKKEKLKKESSKKKIQLEDTAKENKITKSNQREILRSGRVKYIIVKPGDTFYKIAQETDKDLWQLYKFNDLSPTEKIIPGNRLYLQPKKRKAKELIHIVKKGDTMKSISQMYCIKLNQLYRKNNMREWEEPQIGQQLNLQKRKQK